MNVAFKLPPSVFKIINYVRKSRDEEEQEQRDPSFNALERQRLQMEAVLKPLGIPFVQETEVGSGDKIESRPVFKRILEQIRNGEYQAIAVREIQRLGRGSYEDMGEIYTLLEEKRIYIITQTRIYDLRNKDDAKFVRMQLFMAREEYFFIKERLIDAKYFFASQGKFMSSRPPFGYDTNRKTKVLEIVPEQAKIVKMIFDLYLNGGKDNRGLGYNGIASFLTKSNIPTYTGKKMWQGRTIAVILKNRAYIGEIRYRLRETVGGSTTTRPEDEWIIVENAHEPIIDLEIFEAAQNKLIDRKENLPLRLEFDPCELAGLVTCECGRKMVRHNYTQRHTKLDGAESVYKKEYIYCRFGCQNRSFNYRGVEDYILTGLGEIAALPDNLLKDIISKTLLSNDKYQQASNEIISALEKQLSTLKQRLDNAYESFEDGIYTKDEFKKRREELQNQIQSVEEQIEIEEEKRSQVSDAPLNILKDNLNTVVETYREIENKTLKNQLLRKVIQNVTIDLLEKGAGKRKPKIRVNITLKDAFISSSLK